MKLSVERSVQVAKAVGPAAEKKGTPKNVHTRLSFV